MRSFSVILLILAFTILSVYFIVSQMFGDVGEPSYREIALSSSNRKSKLYIQVENRGLMGDSQLTVISTASNKKFEADSLHNIIFRGLEPFLYKSNQDTLFLYVREKAHIPKGFHSEWVIKQIEIDNPRMMDLRRNNQFNKI